MTQERETGDKFREVAITVERVPVEQLAEIMPDIAIVTYDALGFLPPDIQKVVGNLDAIYIAKEGVDVKGFSGFRLLEVPKVGLVIHEAVKMVGRSSQGKGLGSSLSREVVAAQPDAKYFTFTTQNPAQILSIRRSLPTEFIAPLDRTYMDSDLFWDFYRTRETLGYQNIVPETGLKRGVYWGQRFGNYEVDLSNPSVAAIEKEFERIGFNRDRGDGVFLMAKLIHDAV